MRGVPRGTKEAVLSSIVGYKAGMTSAIITEESQRASETSRACTVIEVPATEVYGIRLYVKDIMTGYLKVGAELYDKNAAAKAGVKKIAADTEKIDAAKRDIGKYSNVSLLMASYPKGTATGQHHQDRFEAQVLGKSPGEKFEYAAKLLGKEVKPSDIFKNGEYIDVISISKGKGWKGVIKRFGASRQPHKSTQKVRHIAPLGSYGVGRVLPSVPQSGQLGFNYRTEHNKRILKIGKKDEAQNVNPKQGFINYGNVVSDYIVVDGSMPGPAKRLVRIRKSIDNKNMKGIKEPKVSYITTTGKAI